MNLYCSLALILAALLICPAAADQTQAIVTNIPATIVPPPANVTAAPPLPVPEPVTVLIPATTVVPSSAPTATLSGIMSIVPPTQLPAPVTSGIPATPLALPPHELDSGSPLSNGFGISGPSGFSQDLPSGTVPGITPAADGNTPLSHPTDPQVENTCGTYKVQCRLWLAQLDAGTVEYGCSSNCVTTWEKTPGCDTCWQSKTTCSACGKSERSDWDFNMDCTGAHGFQWFTDWYQKGIQTSCSGHPPKP